MSLQALTLEPPGPPRLALLWLHGLDNSAEADREYLRGMLPADVLLVLPQAPRRHSTILGRQASSWFDIYDRTQHSFDSPMSAHFNTAEIEESAALLCELVAAVLKRHGLEYHQLLVAGFSQGCGMSFHLACLLPPLRGALGVAGYLFEVTPFAKKCELVLVYGDSDSTRPWQYAGKSYEGKLHGFRVRLVEGMGHELVTCRATLA
jgi:predicted esterase